MTLRARIQWLFLGDPPAYPPDPVDRRTIDLAGLAIPALATLALLVVTVVLLLDRSHDLLPRFGPVHPESLRNQAIERFVAFGLLPLGILVALREDPRRYGLGVGDRRRGILLLGLLTVISVPAIVVIARLPEIRDWYAPSMTTVADVALTNLLDLVPAEFLLRGFLLFALVRVIGPAGVLVAIVPFVFSHIGKPDLETLSTIGGGFVFGWLAWRTGSVWYGGLYHVVIQTAVIVAAAA